MSTRYGDHGMEPGGNCAQMMARIRRRNTAAHASGHTRQRPDRHPSQPPMPPPYFPASSLAVILLLAAVATVPPLAMHLFRHRGPYAGWQKLLGALVGAAWAALTIPELVRLSSFPEAVACWIQHSAFVLTVSAICTVVVAIGSRGTGRGRASDEPSDAMDSRAASSVIDNPKAASH